MMTKIYCTEGPEKTAVLFEDGGFTFIQRDAEDMARVFSNAEDASDILGFLQGSGSAANVFSAQGEIRLRRGAGGVTVSQFDDIWVRVVLSNEQAIVIAQAMAAAMS
jgi:hypothetical protein